MVTSARSGAGFLLAACAVLVFGVLVAYGSDAGAQAKGPVKLVFNLPEGTVLNYESFNQLNQNYSGTDVTMNQTSTVEMVYGAPPDSTGASRVDLKYVEVKSSLVQGGRLMEWEPPIKLEGTTIKIWILPTANIVRFDPGRRVPGMSSPEDLREIVDAWFVKFPEGEVAIGQTWTEDVVRGKRDEGPPEAQGQMVYTLKKVEKKGDLEVAVIEGKMKLVLNKDTSAGVLVGEGKTSLKAQVALAGGYIVELKESIDINGEIVAKDPLTDKETRRGTAVTQTYERKLKR
jgi:hypothetical protein